MAFSLIIENIFGALAMISSLIGLCPQVYKAWKTKSMDDVSMGMLINYLLGSFFWIGYGIMQSAFFVLISNIIGFLISGLAVYQKRYFDAQKSRKTDIKKV